MAKTPSASESTIGELIRHWGRMSADKPAIICNNEAFSYGAFVEELDAILRHLDEAGIARGGRVVIAISDKKAFIVAMLGVMSAGAVAVPVVGESAAAIVDIADHTDAELMLHDGEDEDLFGDLPRQRYPFTSDTVIGDAMRLHSDIADPAVILFTSGTQSHRKGVVLSHANLNATGDYLNRFLYVDPDIREYVIAPPFHAFGFGRVRSVLMAGGTVVFDAGEFNALRAIRGIETHACNSLSCVSATIILLVEKFRGRTESFAQNIRWMEIGSQPMQRDQKKLICDTFASARTAFNYGMTEASRSTLIDFNQERSRLDSSGRAAPGTELRICDEQRQLMTTGKLGVIEMRGPHIALGYWRDDTLWAKACVDGWFRSDDVGYMDNEGYLYYVGRSDDLLNVGGEIVAPTDLEYALRQRLGDEEFIILGESDRIRGEVPVICFERSDATNLEWPELMKTLIGAVPNKFLPRKGYVAPQFPRTAVGKIKRAQLRNQIKFGELTEIERTN